MSMKKERATVSVRLYPSTHKRIKIAAAKTRVSFAKCVDLVF